VSFVSRIHELSLPEQRLSFRQIKEHIYCSLYVYFVNNLLLTAFRSGVALKSNLYGIRPCVNA